MKIDGQCHCGSVTYAAEIDPELVSICHCTDCQGADRSPYRVTVICSAGQVRMPGQPPKIYRKRGDNGRTRFQHFCAECGSPLFTSGDGRVRRFRHSLGQHPPARPSATETADLVPLRGAVDQ